MNRDRIQSEIDSLVEQTEWFGTESFELAKDCAVSNKIRTDNVDWVRVEDLMEEYEVWFNQSLTVVSSYLPRREADFTNAYSTIASLINLDNCDRTKVEVYNSEFRRDLTTQRNLLKSIPPKLDAEKLRVRKEISSEVASEEVHQAKRLFEGDLIRPAGVIAGVAIERHLLTRCEVSERDVEYEYDYGIKALAQALYNADIISKTQHGQIEYLAKLRNQCAHADEEEPTPTDVDRLITQTEDILRET